MIKISISVVCIIALLCGSALTVRADDTVIYEKTPKRSEGISTAAALSLDLFPGGGHLYLGDYGRAGFFGTMKIGGGGALYFFYKDWRKRQRYYRGAERIRTQLGVSTSTKIHGPDGRFRSVNAYKKEYDRAAQKMTFSVIGNTAVYAVSWIMVYGRCCDINEGTVPTFDVAFSPDRNNMSIYCSLGIRY
jgi:hypothetical protein